MKFKDALLSTLIIEVGIALLAVINYGATLESLQAVTRFSGRASLLIFSLIFLFQNHKHLKVKSILSEKYFLIFAIAHGIHLVELLSFVYLSGNPLIPIRLAGGFLAYVLIFMMPYAQSMFERNKLSLKAFSSLTLIYLYYVWFIFFMSYLPRVRGTLTNVGGSYSEFVVLLAWVSVLLGIKLQSLLMAKVSSRK
ncbi:MAG TPA: hypothetical protein PLJ13_03590 [Cyclobacteriaceae bacterium]|nr:hypothetical protein [Cyclobacteriaceae bacterium]